MQLLIIFGPHRRVKNIVFSLMHVILGGIFLLLVLTFSHWALNSISGPVKKALRAETLKKEKVSLNSENAYEAKLLQLQVRLDSMQHVLDRMTLAKGGPLRSSFQALSLSDQGEPYGARLDRAFGDSVVLDRRLNQFQKMQAATLETLNAMPSASPLPLPFQISSGLGYRIDPFNHQVAWHEGVDFQASYGTPILATGAGVVIRAAWDDVYGYVVDIRHQNSVVTRYAHAQRLLVKQGDLVSKSQVIALVGSTGRSTGPHLHYEVLIDGKRLTKG